MKNKKLLVVPPYGCGLLLPIELAEHLSTIELVKVSGYNENEKIEYVVDEMPLRLVDGDRVQFAKVESP